MKQNMFIVLAIIIPLIVAPICFMAAFGLALSDSGESTSPSLAILSIFPGIAFLILLSIFLFSEADQISKWQIVAIFIAGILNALETLFILSLAGMTDFKVLR